MIMQHVTRCKRDRTCKQSSDEITVSDKVKNIHLQARIIL